MMNEAISPRDDSWQYVDIYLFSNGQHQTPPRKYHLRNSDLNSWTETLGILAQSQYETILSSIDLYTVEGQKVMTPMQIRQGMAYVAVPPQDTFIHAGYDDYLLRASRSREKRKSTNFTLGESQASVEFNTKADKEYEAKEEVLNVINEEIVETPLAENSNLNAYNELKPEVLIPVKSNNIATKPFSKKNTKIFQSKNTLSTPQAAARKTSMKNKDNSVKKTLKVNTSDNSATASAIVISNHNLIRAKNKVITKTQKSIEKEKSATKPIYILPINDNLNKNIFTESNAIDNILDDRELIVVKNPDSEIASVYLERDKSTSVATRQTRVSSLGAILAPIEESENSEFIKEDIPSTFMDNVAENGTVKSKNVANFNQEIALSPYPEANINIVNNKLPADSSVVTVDNRDVINLNLKIELRKNDGPVCGQYDICPTKLRNIAESGSQANVDQVFVKRTAQPTILASNPESERQSSKIVVVHCACCDHQNFDDVLKIMGTAAVKLEDTNYAILVPSPQDTENVEGQDAKNSAPVPRDRKSIENPVKKVFASTWIHKCLKGYVNPSNKSDDPVAVSDNKLSNVVNKVNSNNDIKTTSSKVQLDVIEEVNTATNIIDKKVSESNIEQVSSKHVATKESVIKCDSKFTTEKSTQTDWGSILLEARRHENGLYSFHLPPLHILKYYGI